jgi:molybdopterin-guanine dinucleotide biosynthesis protein
MLVVVGGHSRNIGKTSVVAGLIRKLRDRNWTALKITQYGHGICSSKGEACGCEAGAADDPEHPFALSEEYEPSGTDSGRFLAAGAARSFWLRTPMGELKRASAVMDKILAQNDHVIVESNSVLELVQPDLFLMVLDFSAADFKPSSLRFMDRADAFVVIDRGLNVPMWEDVAKGSGWDQKPQFPVIPPDYGSTALARFVKSRCPAATAFSGTKTATRSRP